MKANELRIGNLIQWEDDSNNIVKVATIGGKGKPWVRYDELDPKEPSGVARLFEFIPIPLTKEWLLKLGFGDFNGYFARYWGKNGFEIIVWNNYYKKYFFELAKGRTILIDYVHQLQNLYFALTGEELKLITE